MQLDKIVWNFSVYRSSGERRKKISLPPYFTEEGMTLVDQRVKDDRRVDARDCVCNPEEEFSFS